MARRHGFGQQGVGHRQHAAGAGAHQEAHDLVPQQRRHGAADRGADEDDGRQQDGRLAPVNVGDDTPQDRAGDRADQGKEGHQRGLGLGDAVFLDQARHDEPKTGGFHDIDDEGNDQNDHQQDVRRAQLGVFRRDHGNARGGLGLFANALGQQAITRDTDAGDDEKHAEQHVIAHRHAGQFKAHRPAHHKHRQVQKDARADHDAAEHESPDPTPVEKYL